MGRRRRRTCRCDSPPRSWPSWLRDRNQASTPEPFLLKKSGQHFYNTSKFDLKTIVGDQDHIAAVREIFDHFEFQTEVDRLSKAGLLYLVTERFANIDLHPNKFSNDRMGEMFEELIRRFAELSNETAEEHFTAREVIALMVDVLFCEDDEALSKPGVVRTL